MRIVRSTTRRGFTLIEMLVVVAIILALLGILVGAVGQFSATASTAASQQMLAAIEMGLKAYETDHGSFPPSNAAVNGVGGSNAGGSSLAGALFAPLSSDGKTGYGFTSGGRSYGPYLSAKHESNLTAASSTAVITMADSPGKKAVLYYKFVGTGGTGKAIGASGSVWSSNGRFVIGHNDGLDGSDNPTTYWQSPGTAGKASVGQRDGFAGSLRAAKFLLVYPGPDDKYGTEDDLYKTGK